MGHGRKARRDKQRKPKGPAAQMKKYLIPVSPMRLSWNTGIFLSFFIQQATMNLGVPLMRVTADPPQYLVTYLWHRVIEQCKECETKPPNDPPYPLQMQQDTGGAWFWDCPACGHRHWVHSITAFVQVREYGKLICKEMRGTHGKMEKIVREAWEMNAAYIDSQNRAAKDLARQTRG